MNILFKYLSSEPLQNAIACLNYEFDQVVLYANISAINKQHSLKKLLLDKCSVKSVKFFNLDNASINELIERINRNTRNDKVFIDFTGCEGICSSAFIEACSEYNLCGFTYDIYRDEVISLFKSDLYSLKDVTYRKVKLSIDDYIQIAGGVIREDLSKNYKSGINDEDFKKVSAFKERYKHSWPYFSSVMQVIHNRTTNTVDCPKIDMILHENDYHITKPLLIDMLRSLNRINLINNLDLKNGISFEFKNEYVKAFIIDPGSIFERKVYLKEKKDSDECKIGVHLDWDGIVLKDTSKDVYNEIDILKLNNYFLTFISCKDTIKFNKYSLYELESIASRFGGKFCKMKLVCTCDVSDADKQRAKSMGIEIINHI